MITEGKRKFFRYCKYCGAIILNDKGYKATVCPSCYGKHVKERNKQSSIRQIIAHQLKKKQQRIK